MVKVYMTCGKICSGKSTYAADLRERYGAVLLSVDEITLALFGQHAGEKHDEYVERTEKYLFSKSLEIVRTGISVVLDWGFWTKEEREYAKAFYASENIECEFHYIDVSDAEWHRRLEKRNREIEAGEVLAYYVDENLAAKFDGIFERPGRAEMDVWVSAERE